MRYYATVVTGLESLAAQEIEEVAGGAVDSLRPGKVFFRAEEVSALPKLRSVMNIYAHLHEEQGFPADESARRGYEGAGEGLALEAALEAYAARRGRPSAPSFRITAQRAGDHAYHSQDIAAWVGAGLQRATGWRVDLERFDYEIQVDVDGARALFGLRLTPQTIGRRERAVYHPTTLNATVAYAMVRLVGVSADDVLMDPMCGGATLLLERAELGPWRRLIGGDIWPHSLRAARRNLAAAGVAADLFRWDARRLPLEEGCVNRVVSNLPFGHRVSHYRAVRRLYREFIAELARVLEEGGKAALLTSRKRLLLNALHSTRALRLDQQRLVNLGGKQAFIFVLAK